MKQKFRLGLIIVLLFASISSYSYLSVESNRAELLQASSRFDLVSESPSEERRSVLLPEVKITQRILDFAASLVLPR
jgi:hypothetical protein